MRTLAPLLCLSVGALAACEGSARSEATARDPGGAFQVELLHEAETYEQGDKTMWEMPHVTVTLQRVGRTRLNRDETLAGIAAALVRRHQEGEVDGNLTQHRCELAGEPARCTGGWIADGDRIVERRGFLVGRGDELLLLEVLAERGPAETVLDEQVDLIEESFTWLRDDA